MTVIGVTGDRAFLRRLNALPSGQVLVRRPALRLRHGHRPGRRGGPLDRSGRSTARSSTSCCPATGRAPPTPTAGPSSMPGSRSPTRVSSARSPSAPPTPRRRPGSRSPTWPTGTSSWPRRSTWTSPRCRPRTRRRWPWRPPSRRPGSSRRSPPSGSTRGPIDGQPSDALTASIAALQQQLGLPATGVYDAETDAALRQKLGTAGTAVNEATASLQRALRDLGYYDGPIDGTYSAATVAGVRAFQASIGVPQTGIVDAATLRAIFDAGGGVRAAAPPRADDGADHSAAADRRRRPPTEPPTAPATVAPTAPPTAAAHQARRRRPPGADRRRPRRAAGHDRADHDRPRRRSSTTSSPPSAPTPASAPTSACSRGRAGRLAGPPRTGDGLRADQRRLRRPSRRRPRRGPRGPGQAPRPVADGHGGRPRRRGADLDPGATITSLSGTTLTVGGTGNAVTVNGATRGPARDRRVERHHPAHQLGPPAGS